MKAITVTMSKDAYDFYEQNWKEKGSKEKKAFSKEALIKYINKTGGYMGEVTDIAVE